MVGRRVLVAVAVLGLLSGLAGCRPRAGDPLTNASLEDDLVADGVPDCFTAFGWGRNTSAFARADGARTGQWAERVAITARTDGERLLAITLDDACSPTTVEDGRFTAVAWYHSTVPVTVVAYAQRPTGWALWYRATPLPASATFREARVALPAVPPGVTGVSFGLAISAVGEVVTDDYALEPSDPAAPVPTPQPDCRDGYVGLTYDDGPAPTTPALLDALAGKGARATFFLVGNQMIPERQATLARQVAGGHVIGNHTWDHPELPPLTDDEIRDQLNRTTWLAVASGVPRPTLFRPPYGATNDRVAALATDLGMAQVIWTIDTNDWQGVAVDETVRRALDGARAGSVVLFHDRMPNSVAAVPAVVDGLRTRGLCPGVIRPSATFNPRLGGFAEVAPG
jgi:peptidoglycan/xylan/chitin deacetylase (PgdA/CDA1 family)